MRMICECVYVFGGGTQWWEKKREKKGEREPFRYGRMRSSRPARQRYVRQQRVDWVFLLLHPSWEKSTTTTHSHEKETTRSRVCSMSLHILYRRLLSKIRSQQNRFCCFYFIFLYNKKVSLFFSLRVCFPLDYFEKKKNTGQVTPAIPTVCGWQTPSGSD